MDMLFHVVSRPLLYAVDFHTTLHFIFDYSLVLVCNVHLNGLSTRRASHRLFELKHTFRVGYTVAQLVEALCYTPEGRGFHSGW
jgi:hypothetical protein